MGTQGKCEDDSDLWLADNQQGAGLDARIIADAIYALAREARTLRASLRADIESLEETLSVR